MKILWLYSYKPDYDFDNWLHMRFVEYMHKYSELKVVAYGPDLHISSPEVTPIRYNPSIDINTLDKEFHFDAIICNTKSRMFEYYNPHNNTSSGMWLPKDFSKTKIPKIEIQEDAHYELDGKWYKEMNFDLILQRHYESSLKDWGIITKWFPFSVDTKTFCDGHYERINKVCMAGSVNSAYPERQLACNILNKHQLIEIYSGKQMIGPKYIQCLKQYVCHLSGSSRYHITPAKMFEIMASGSVLLTNEEKDLPLLFDEGSYATYDDKIGSNEEKLVILANKILTDGHFRRNITEKAVKCIKERHSHDIRIKQLMKIIEYLPTCKNLTDFNICDKIKE